MNSMITYCRGQFLATSRAKEGAAPVIFCHIIYVDNRAQIIWVRKGLTIRSILLSRHQGLYYFFSRRVPVLPPLMYIFIHLVHSIQR